MSAATDILDSFSVPYVEKVLSAHRTPAETQAFAEKAEENGIQVIIAGAGLAAHLAGVTASHTLLPVIGVPVAAGPFAGFDSLLSTVQMPGGIPVAAVAVGKAGAKNAALLSIEILALADKKLREALREYRRKLGADITSGKQ
jgi:phosphoribosylaminoimidazole carboxylase PurE protein